MAKGKGESISGLYLRIGLNYDELNQDFVNVEQTLSDNVKRLNRKNTLIDLKAQINLVGADTVQKLKIQEEQLTRQIEIQREKIKLYEADWISAGKANGYASSQAELAAIALKKQELELTRLSQQLKNVRSQQQAAPKDNNRLFASYNNIKGNVAGVIGNLTNSFNGLSTASQSVDGALSKTVEVIGNIPHPVAQAVAALAAIPFVAVGIENSLLNMAKPAIAAGDSLYVMARGMQISTQDMAKLSMISQVTGIEVTEVNNSLRRLSASLTKADVKSTLATKTLQKYGASIRDSNGNIKQGTALVSELAKAFATARALGKGAEFRDAVGGRFWSADFVTFLEDYEGNVELAGKVIKNGLANPVLAHAVQGEINAMNAQAKQLGSTFSSAFLPVANYIVPHVRQRMGDLTSIIEKNAETIKNVGFRIGEVVDKVGEFTTKVVEVTAAVAKFATTNQLPDSAFVAKYVDNKEIKNFEDFHQKFYETLDDGQRKALEYNKAIGYISITDSIFYSREKNIWRKIQKEREKIVEEEKRAAVENAESEQKLSEYEAQQDLEENLKLLEKYSDELSKIKLELKFDNKPYQKSLAELEDWYKDALDKTKNQWEARTKIEEIYNVKLQQIKRKHNDEIKKLVSETSNIEFERTHSAFEKQLRDIEQWKKAQFDKAGTAQEVSAIIANAAAKEAQAFENEMDRIRGKTQTLQEKIFGLTHSQRDKDIYNLEKEIAQLASEGIYDQREILRYANLSLAKISQNKDKSYIQQPNLPQKFNLPIENFWAQIQDKVDAYTNIQRAKLKQSMAEQKGYKLPTIDFSPINAHSLYKFNNVQPIKTLNNLQLNPPSKTFNLAETNNFVPANLRDNDKNQRNKEAAQKVAAKATENNFTTPSFGKELNQMTRQISELTQIAGSIAQDAQERQQYQPPNITVQPNININLGGAYVFDNALKAQLTGDITAEVANAVKSAVNQSLTQADFSIKC